MKDFESLKRRIAEYVTLGDLLAAEGKIPVADMEEQYSCDFHGADRKKSARYYADTDSSYCWVCKRRWDLFSYVQQREAMTFWQAVSYLVRQYRIPTGDLPEAIEETRRRRIEAPAVKVDESALVVERLLQAIRMLRGRLEDEKYERIVFAYMLLRHATPEDKRREAAETLRGAVLRVVEGARNG